MYSMRKFLLSYSQICMLMALALLALLSLTWVTWSEGEDTFSSSNEEEEDRDLGMGANRFKRERQHWRSSMRAAN